MKHNGKQIIRTIRSFCRRRYDGLRRFIAEHYRDTQKGIILLCKALASIILSVYMTDGCSDHLVFRLIAVPAAIVIYGGLSLAVWILHKVRKWIQEYRTGTLVAAGVLYYTLYSVIRLADTSEMISIISATVITVLEIMFARNVWALIRKKRRTLLIVTVCIGTTICNVLIGFLVFGEGFQEVQREKYLNFAQPAKEVKALSEDCVYSVESYTYGVTEQEIIHTNTVNLTKFTRYHSDWTEKFRKIYWGYGLADVPVKGKIWYPKDLSNCPVLFIIHGNHSMTSPSYEGYGYLGEYLASNGYVVVSVDQSMLNGYLDHGLIGENDARAILLLENMKSLFKMNQKENHPLYHKMDERNVAIAGHSRGGEAAAVAALLNQYSVYPDNGQVRLDYHYPIKTVIAIAPSCDQYKPGGRSIELKDVNYFLIHGSNDMDLTEFLGMKQYENVSFSGNGNYRKAYLYVASANHVSLIQNGDVMIFRFQVHFF